MTAQARISQADFDKATKVATDAVKRRGVKSARVIFRLEQREIEIIVSETGAAEAERNPFDEA